MGDKKTGVQWGCGSAQEKGKMKTKGRGKKSRFRFGVSLARKGRLGIYD